MLIQIPQVWFVDDDEDDRLTLRMAFDELQPPVSVLTLNNGQQLLAEITLEGVLPHLLLLDLSMPGLTGLEVLRELRAKPALSILPIVMLTTSSSLIHQQDCLAAGATDFITKPTSYQQLKRLAQQLTQRWVPNHK